MTPCDAYAKRLVSHFAVVQDLFDSITNGIKSEKGF